MENIKVVIVGGGPAGLAQAAMLCKNQYTNVHVYDCLSDPLSETHVQHKFSYSISVSVRGYKALEHLGLRNPTHYGIPKQNSYFRFGSNDVIIKDPFATTLVRRYNLVKNMTEDLKRLYGAHINFHYGKRLDSVSFETNTLTFVNDEPVKYDFLVASDGANSIVRATMQRVMRPFGVSQRPAPFAIKNMTLNSESCKKLGLDTRCAYWRFANINGSDDNLVLLGNGKGGMDVNLNYDYKNKSTVQQLSNPEATHQYLIEGFGKELADSLELHPEFFTCSLLYPMSVTCSDYTYSNNVILVGDAAHAMLPTFGQGCNSALEDAVVLDEIMRECHGNVNKAATLWTERRQPDGVAITELSSVLPPTNNVQRLKFFMPLVIPKHLNRILPKLFSTNVNILASSTHTPYRELVTIKNRHILLANAVLCLAFIFILFVILKIVHLLV